MNIPGIQKTIPLLGGTVEFFLYTSSHPLTDNIFDEIFAEALRLQKIFNFFDPESELTLLNTKREMIVSTELQEVIRLCLPYCALTNGAYDITKGKQILERKKNLPLTPVHCSYKDIALEGNSIALLHEDVLIDLGSVAKGYIGDKLKEFLIQKGITSAFIDLRGDLIFYGHLVETIQIQHPRDAQKTIYSFEQSNAAVATSGDYHQYHEKYENSHILNAKDICSVTVLSDSLVEADILASCLFTAGSQNLTPYQNEQYFVVDNRLNIYKSKTFV